MRYNYFDSLKGTLLLFLILIAFIGIWVYVFYKIYIRNSTDQTVDDIQLITQNIAADISAKSYNDFNADAAVLGEYLPYDLSIDEDESGHFSIMNRFGGQIYFFASVADSYELAQVMAADKYNYEKGKMGAYIIKLTGLSSRVCRILAQVDWIDKISNILGFAAGDETLEQQSNRPDNLHKYVLSDNKDETMYNWQQLHISQRMLTRDEARQICECGWHRCYVALKFK